MNSKHAIYPQWYFSMLLVYQQIKWWQLFRTTIHLLKNEEIYDDDDSNNGFLNWQINKDNVINRYAVT